MHALRAGDTNRGDNEDSSIGVLLKQVNKARECKSTTPDTLKRIIESKLERAKNEYDDTWKSCVCGSSDKRAVLYFSQLSILLLVMGFCFVQLVRLPDCGDQQLYSSILTMVIGILIPSPKMSRKKE